MVAHTETSSVNDALDIAEQALNADEWITERTSDGALHCAAPTQWGECGGVFIWGKDPPALHFSLTLELRSSACHRPEIMALVTMINERLWLGHFDCWFESGAVVFRHTLPMFGRKYVEPGEISSIGQAAIEAIDRFLPAFNYVAWAGKPATEAFQLALMETSGQA